MKNKTWYVEGHHLCFDLNELATYTFSINALLIKPVSDWLDHLRPKIWFCNERDFRNKYYELKYKKGR